MRWILLLLLAAVVAIPVARGQFFFPMMRGASTAVPLAPIVVYDTPIVVQTTPVIHQ